VSKSEATSGPLRWLGWGLLFPIVFLNGWLISQFINTLQPLFSVLVTATLLAFLLNFPIQALQARKLPRLGAVIIVFSLTLLLFIALGLTLIPLIVQQLQELVTNLPRWIESGNQQLQRLLQNEMVAQQISQLSVDLQELLNLVKEKLVDDLQSLSSQVLSFSNRLLDLALNTIDNVINFILTLVLTVFAVLTGPRAWAGLFSWLPQPWNAEMPQIIQKTFQNYFASQAILAGILSLAQTIVFLVLGVPYAVLFGVVIGLTTLVPYASALTIIVVSVLLSLQNITLGLKVLAAAIVVGQINDNVVAPRLVGNMTGLNPLWLIIALLLGGKFAGLLGLLLAVPLASVVKATGDRLKVAQPMV